ncbi:MAG: hypothetical protein ABIQ31_20320 [Ferruginibacter sp.]
MAGNLSIWRKSVKGLSQYPQQLEKASYSASVSSLYRGYELDIFAAKKTLISLL